MNTKNMECESTGAEAHTDTSDTQAGKCRTDDVLSSFEKYRITKKLPILSNIREQQLQASEAGHPSSIDIPSLFKDPRIGSAFSEAERLILSIFGIESVPAKSPGSRFLTDKGIGDQQLLSLYGLVPTQDLHWIDRKPRIVVWQSGLHKWDQFPSSEESSLVSLCGSLQSLQGRKRHENLLPILCLSSQEDVVQCYLLPQATVSDVTLSDLFKVIESRSETTITSESHKTPRFSRLSPQGLDTNAAINESPEAEKHRSIYGRSLSEDLEYLAADYKSLLGLAVGLARVFWEFFSRGISYEPSRHTLRSIGDHFILVSKSGESPYDSLKFCALQRLSKKRGTRKAHLDGYYAKLLGCILSGLFRDHVRPEMQSLITDLCGITNRHGDDRLSLADDFMSMIESYPEIPFPEAVLKIERLSLEYNLLPDVEILNEDGTLVTASGAPLIRVQHHYRDGGDYSPLIVSLRMPRFAGSSCGEITTHGFDHKPEPACESSIRFRTKNPLQGEDHTRLQFKIEKLPLDHRFLVCTVPIYCAGELLLDYQFCISFSDGSRKVLLSHSESYLRFKNYLYETSAGRWPGDRTKWHYLRPYIQQIFCENLPVSTDFSIIEPFISCDFDIPTPQGDNAALYCESLWERCYDLLELLQSGFVELFAEYIFYTKYEAELCFPRLEDQSYGDRETVSILLWDDGVLYIRKYFKSGRITECGCDASVWVRGIDYVLECVSKEDHAMRFMTRSGIVKPFPQSILRPDRRTPLKRHEKRSIASQLLLADADHGILQQHDMIKKTLSNMSSTTLEVSPLFCTKEKQLFFETTYTRLILLKMDTVVSFSWMTCLPDHVAVTIVGVFNVQKLKQFFSQNPISAWRFPIFSVMLPTLQEGISKFVRKIGCDALLVEISPVDESEPHTPGSVDIILSPEAPQDMLLDVPWMIPCLVPVWSHIMKSPSDLDSQLGSLFSGSLAYSDFIHLTRIPQGLEYLASKELEQELLTHMLKLRSVISSLQCCHIRTPLFSSDNTQRWLWELVLTRIPHIFKRCSVWPNSYKKFQKLAGNAYIVCPSEEAGDILSYFQKVHLRRSEVSVSLSQLQYLKAISNTNCVPRKLKDLPAKILFSARDNDSAHINSPAQQQQQQQQQQLQLFLATFTDKDQDISQNLLWEYLRSSISDTIVLTVTQKIPREYVYSILCEIAARESIILDMRQCLIADQPAEKEGDHVPISVKISGAFADLERLKYTCKSLWIEHCKLCIAYEKNVQEDRLRSRIQGAIPQREPFLLDVTTYLSYRDYFCLLATPPPTHTILGSNAVSLDDFKLLERFPRFALKHSRMKSHGKTHPHIFIVDPRVARENHHSFDAMILQLRWDPELLAFVGCDEFSSGLMQYWPETTTHSESYITTAGASSDGDDTQKTVQYMFRTKDPNFKYVHEIPHSQACYSFEPIKEMISSIDGLTSVAFYLDPYCNATEEQGYGFDRDCTVANLQQWKDLFAYLESDSRPKGLSRVFIAVPSQCQEDTVFQQLLVDIRSGDNRLTDVDHAKRFKAVSRTNPSNRGKVQGSLEDFSCSNMRYGRLLCPNLTPSMFEILQKKTELLYPVAVTVKMLSPTTEVQFQGHPSMINQSIAYFELEAIKEKLRLDCLSPVSQCVHSILDQNSEEYISVANLFKAGFPSLNTSLCITKISNPQTERLCNFVRTEFSGEYARKWYRSLDVPPETVIKMPIPFDFALAPMGGFTFHKSSSEAHKKFGTPKHMFLVDEILLEGCSPLTDSSFRACLRYLITY